MIFLSCFLYLFLLQPDIVASSHHEKEPFHYENQRDKYLFLMRKVREGQFLKDSLYGKSSLQKYESLKDFNAEMKDLLDQHGLRSLANDSIKEKSLYRIHKFIDPYAALYSKEKFIYKKRESSIEKAFISASRKNYKLDKLNQGYKVHSINLDKNYTKNKEIKSKESWLDDFIDEYRGLFHEKKRDFYKFFKQYEKCNKKSDKAKIFCNDFIKNSSIEKSIENKSDISLKKDLKSVSSKTDLIDERWSDEEF